MHDPSFGYIFKIILKILGGLLLIGLIGLCFTSIVMLIILGGSVAALLAWFAGVWNSIAKYNSIQPIPFATNPIQTTPIIIASPQVFPTLLPLPTSMNIESGWQTEFLNLYGYQVDIPTGWYIEEERLSLPSSACNLGHDLANYKIFNTIGSEIQIQFLCWVRDMIGAPYCSGDAHVLDEGRGIVRSKISDNDFHYGHFEKAGDGGFFCFDGWEIADQGNGMTVNEIADYTQTSGIEDLSIVDRIVTSIKPLYSMGTIPTIIYQPPTWTPTKTSLPTPTRTKAPTWTSLAYPPILTPPYIPPIVIKVPVITYGP